MTFPGMGGIADARTNGLGFAGVAADSNVTSPVEEMGAAARVDVVVVGIDEGKLDGSIMWVVQQHSSVHDQQSMATQWRTGKQSSSSIMVHMTTNPTLLDV